MKNGIFNMGKKITLLFAIILLSNMVKAKNERTFQELVGTGICENALIPTVKDSKYDLLSGSLPFLQNFTEKQIKSYLYLSVIPIETVKSEDFTLKVGCDVTYYEYTNPVFIRKTETVFLDVSYNNTQGLLINDKTIHEFNNALKIEVKIISIESSLPGNVVSPIVHLGAAIDVERYYGFHESLLGVFNYDLRYTKSTGKFLVEWDDNPEFEAYDLEYTWATDDLILPNVPTYDFKNNSTRVRVTGNSYIIPDVFETGYVLFRIRGIGRDIYVDPDKEIYDNWFPVPSNNQVSNYPAKYHITASHENLKNWTYATTFAEEGKRKDVISYFDGSYRNRQQVTNMNIEDYSSSNENISIIKETIYDHMGRPAIQVLPAPYLDDQPFESQIKYYENFNLNKNGTPSPYNMDNFDVYTTGSCVAIPSAMSTQSGASGYYSPDNIRKHILPYSIIPDAEEFPFTQTEFMPDNTGRIKRQSGVGKNHQIGTGHETIYEYSRPSQGEINKLFGVEVGHMERYQKNVVIDANGQISITYLNAGGKTVATALAGETPKDINGNPLLEPLGSNIPAIEPTDLLKKSNGLLESPKIDPENGILEIDYPIFSEGAFTYTFNYTAEAVEFTYCLPEGVCYNCKYNLTLSIKDECGEEMPKTINGTTTNDVLIYPLGTFDSICGNNPPPIQTEFTVLFEKGKRYHVYKRLEVDMSDFNTYFEHFLKNNVCEIKDLSYFIDSALSTIDSSQCFPFDDCEDEFIEKYGKCESGVCTIWDGKSVLERTIEGIKFPIGYQGYNAAMERYISSCEYEPTCDMLIETIKNDVMPGGQYALYSYNSISPSFNLPTNDADSKLNIFTPVSNNLLMKFKGLTSTDGDAGFNCPRYNGDENDPHYYNINEADDSLIIAEISVPSATLIIGTKIGDDLDNPDNVIIYPEQLRDWVVFLKHYYDHPEWANSLYWLHPEFCYTNYCELYNSKPKPTETQYTESPDKYAEYLLGIESYYNASTFYSYIDPANIYAIMEKDRFFSSLLGLNSMVNERIHPSTTLSNVMRSRILNYATEDNGITYYNMLQYAIKIVYGKYETILLTNLANDECFQDRIWQTYRNLYLQERGRLVEESRMQYAIVNKCYNGCMGIPTYNNGFVTESKFYCDIAYNDNFNTGDNPSNSSCNPIYPPCTKIATDCFNGPIESTPVPGQQCQPCYRVYAEYFISKRPRFVTFQSVMDMSGAPQDVASANDQLRDKCQEQCESYADYWMDKLSQCTYSTPSKWDELRAELIKICNCGCDENSPWGAIEKNPATSPVPPQCIGVNYSNFDAAIEGVLGISTSKDLCSQDLISMPGKYGAELDVNDGKMLDDCACNAVFATKQDFENPSIYKPGYIKTWADYFEYKYKVEIDPSILCTCEYAWNSVDDPPAPQWSPTAPWVATQLDALEKTAAVVPFKVSCDADGGCIYCQDINAAYSELNAKYPTGYSDDILANYCNNKFGFKLSAANYKAFKEKCDNNLPTDERGDKIVLENLKKLIQTMADHHQFLPPTTAPAHLRLSPYKDFWVPILSVGIGGIDETCDVSDDCNNDYCSVAGNFRHSLVMDFSYQEPNGLVRSKLLTLHAISVNGNNTPPNIIPPNYIPQTLSVDNIDYNSAGGINVTISYSGTIEGHISKRYTVIYGMTCLIPGGIACRCFNEIISDALKLCNESAEFDVLGYNCVEELKKTAIYNATIKFEEYIKDIKEDFRKKFIARCTEATETYTMTGGTNVYHYTLYYYDLAGNLVKTIPPAGVNPLSQTLNNDIDDYRKHQNNPAHKHIPSHILPTNYKYNSLNQLVEQKTPDAGVSNFWYDRLGRIVLSQNAKQYAPTKQYSYTLYDNLGRITEVGQIATNQAITGSIVNNQALFNDLIKNTSQRTQITKTYYDNQTAPPNLFTGGQQNLRTRVSCVKYFENKPNYSENNYQSATYYSYDIHGNVKELVQDIPELASFYSQYKKIQYLYDLVSGKVNMVYYQKDQPDEFIHKYEYDADNRIEAVYTSKDGGITYDKDAKYYYYLHGPLARVELGENKVQGIDYAYTIQGWIKGVNSESLTPMNDIGGDGYSSNPNKFVPSDAFGYSLGYFNGDYLPVNSGSGAFLSEKLANPAPYPLYNGNISSMVTTIKSTSGSGLPMFYHFKYDQLNRLKQAKAYNDFDGMYNTWGNGSTCEGSYQTDLSYDANGNITSLKRNVSSTRDWVYLPKGGWQWVTNTHTMDDLTYQYDWVNINDHSEGLKSNRLFHIEDAVPYGNYDVYIDNQEYLLAPYPNNCNYQYDAIGNLITDHQNGLGIEWNVYGKISKIFTNQKFNEATQTFEYGPEMEFRYDASGNRISKTVKPKDENGNLLPDEEETTYYIRDAQGNIMATYKKKYGTYTPKYCPGCSPAPPALRLFLEDQSIYGSSRIALHTVNDVVSHSIRNRHELGSKQFELTNHLGNVLATVTDKKIPVETTPGSGIIDHYTADITSSQDYYAFGMLMPDRNFSSNSYRFGFNGKEKDDEVKGSGNEYDFGARIYDSRVCRFLSIDPQTKKYPDLTPYCFAANNPILLIDVYGEGPEKPIKVTDVRKAFNNGQTAKSYTFTLYVDQPVGGTRQINYGFNVGHVFIKITKVNADGTIVERTIGFYPASKMPKGSPAIPNVPSTFGDDSDDKEHIPDESVSKSINEKQFNEIMNLAESFEKGNYDLETKNCTDFGLQAAEKAGIKLPDTYATWVIIPIPNLFLVLSQGGSNPANLGQDIIDKKQEIEKQGATVTISTSITPNSNNKETPVVITPAPALSRTFQ